LTASAEARQPADLPLSFRQSCLEHVFPALAAGWSCALVGIAGAGMSNVLRFAAERRVLAHYLPHEAPGMLLVFAEGEGLAAGTGDVFAGLLQLLASAAREAGWPHAEVAALRSLARPQAGGAAEALGEALDLLCRRNRRRVVFVLDDFDRPLVRLPGSTLRRLRGLRDDHKYHLGYLIGLHRDPEHWLACRADLEDAGETGPGRFAELFEQHTFPLKPYNRQDAAVLVARKTAGWRRKPDDEQQAQLYRASGGHARLLVGALIHLGSRLHLAWTNVERSLRADEGLKAVCRAIWDGLDRHEQLSLWHLAREARDELSLEDVQRLALRGLAAGGPPFVASILLEHFVAGLPRPDTTSGRAPRLTRLRDPADQPNW
jgi:hypothetical protein